MLLVGVAFLADIALERHTGALLDDVRSLVRRRVEIRLTGERNVVAGRVRLRAHGSRPLGGLPADVRLDVADVVATERALDEVAMRQRAAGALRAVRRGSVNVAGFDARLAFLLALDRRELRGQCGLARADRRHSARVGLAPLRAGAAIAMRRSTEAHPSSVVQPTAASPVYRPASRAAIRSRLFVERS